jgi:hypothetical protein
MTGRRVDSSAIVRPRELKVGVRLNGKLLVEEATEEAPQVTAGNSKKRKHTTRSVDSSSVDLERRQSIQVSEMRTDEEIADAFAFTFSGISKLLPHKILIEKSTENGSIVWMDINSTKRKEQTIAAKLPLRLNILEATRCLDLLCCLQRMFIHAVFVHRLASCLVCLYTSVSAVYPKLIVQSSVPCVGVMMSQAMTLFKRVQPVASLSIAVAVLTRDISFPSPMMTNRHSSQLQMGKMLSAMHWIQ